MDKYKVDKIRTELNATLAMFDMPGLSIHLGSATYSDSYVKFKLDVSEVTQDGVVKTPDAEAFERYAHRYDLVPQDLGRIFSVRGEQYELIGARPRATKWPLIGRKLRDDSVYKFPPHTVRNNLVPKV